MKETTSLFKECKCSKTKCLIDHHGDTANMQLQKVRQWLLGLTLKRCLIIVVLPY
jgi:hypothetical protein